MHAVRIALVERIGFRAHRRLQYVDQLAVVAEHGGPQHHLGEPVSQNAKGHALGHVKDLGFDYADPEVRGYQTRARLRYHTDYSDLVCLLCLKPAVRGGLSSLVSSVTLYNELLARRPALRVVTISARNHHVAETPNV